MILKEKEGIMTMKTMKIFVIGLILSSAIGISQRVGAQNFRENGNLWKTEIIRARNIDTIRIERHSFFSLPTIDDTTSLVYHEPLPDSVMPKSAIEIGQIIIQAGTAENVVTILEKQARTQGADWIIGFNEPRMKINKQGEIYYRSQAMLYKVINPELIQQDQIAIISCGDNHLQNCASIEAFVKHIVAKSGE
jgi:hypothetical protein